MSTSGRFAEHAGTIRRLERAVVDLEAAARPLRLPPLDGREWFETLRQKLLPQLQDEAFLVVAVVGGTNIGKSVIFNHIAGSRSSSTSPMASGTRHPVCLVPPRFAESHRLQDIFDGFTLYEWTSSETALEDAEEHRLFWQTSEQTPENLLVLDTPDIDSDARVNWQRADRIRRCADVLIAVLTQQKYNDAAVKRFFRKAAAEDKAVIVLFNQCQLPEDEDYWPLWLETFCRETGVEPEFVYVAPNDRRAAEENRLTFYERDGSHGVRPVGIDGDGPRDLAEDLARLRFNEIKLRTLRGSLRHLLDAEHGVPSYLDEVERRSAEFQAAAARLSAESVVKIRDWPVVPNRLLVEEIRTWWRSHQASWARRVHGVYNTVGRGVTWPYRFAKERMQGPSKPPLEQYRAREWSAVLETVEDVFEKLTWMEESGSELLQPHFRDVLAGTSRRELLERLHKAHTEVPLAEELEQVVAAEMDAFQTGSPELYRFYRNLNSISAAVRPATSVVLFTLGWGPAGEVVAPLLADMAAQAVAPVIADFAGGTATAVAGESAVSGAAGRGTGYLQIKFQKLQAAMTARRAAWLARVLKEELLGSLPDDLQAAADVPSSEPFRQVHDLLRILDKQLFQNALSPLGKGPG